MISRYYVFDELKYQNGYVTTADGNIHSPELKTNAKNKI